MPAGVAVVDAFKSLLFFFETSLYTSRILLSLIPDLIRHGKNHLHVRQDEFPSSQAPPSPTVDSRLQPERRQQQDVQAQSQPKQQQAMKAQSATANQSQQLTREVEKIVREEREAMEKLPTYKGLERFKLVEKKGECVGVNPVPPNRLADLFCPQWGILQRVQSFRPHIWDECCWHALFICLPHS